MIFNQEVPDNHQQKENSYQSRYTVSFNRQIHVEVFLIKQIEQYQIFNSSQLIRDSILLVLSH